MAHILGGSTPSAPGIQMPPPAAHPPTLGSTQTALAGQTAKEKAAVAEGMGADNTIATGPQGTTTAPNTAKATLLG